MKLNNRIKDLMSHELITVDQNDKLHKFKRDFASKNVHHIIVENQLDKMVGIISYEDVLKAENFATAHQLTADKIMTQNPEVISENQTVDEALEIFLKNKYRALPVMDQEDKLVGIITPYDILNHISEL